MTTVAMTWKTRRFFGRPWQDLVFSVAEVVFLIALVPMLFNSAVHVTFFAGLTTGLMLYCLAFTQSSYGNWITVSLSVVTATVWVLLGLGVDLSWLI